MMGFGLSLLRAECWVLDQVLDLRTGVAAGRAADPAPGGRAVGRPAAAGGDRPRSAEPCPPRCSMGSAERSRKASRTGMDDLMSPLRRVVLCGIDPDLRTGRAGRPGGDDEDRAAGALRAAGVVPDGAGRLGRARRPGRPRRSSEESQADDYLNRVYESRTPARASRSGSGSTIRGWASTCGIRPRSACRRAAGRRSNRECRVLSVERAGRQAAARSPGWATRKVNWSRGSGFGTTSSERAGWSTTSGACRSPAGAATGGRPAARDDRRGLLPRRQRPGRRGPQRLRQAAARGARTDLARRTGPSIFIP